MGRGSSWGCARAAWQPWSKRAQIHTGPAAEFPGNAGTRGRPTASGPLGVYPSWGLRDQREPWSLPTAPHLSLPPGARPAGSPRAVGTTGWLWPGLCCLPPSSPGARRAFRLQRGPGAAPADPSSLPRTSRCCRPTAPWTQCQPALSAPPSLPRLCLAQAFVNAHFALCQEPLSCVPQDSDRAPGHGSRPCRGRCRGCHRPLGLERNSALSGQGAAGCVPSGSGGRPTPCGSSLTASVCQTRGSPCGLRR